MKMVTDDSRITIKVNEAKQNSIIRRAEAKPKKPSKTNPSTLSQPSLHITQATKNVSNPTETGEAAVRSQANHMFLCSSSLLIAEEHEEHEDPSAPS